MTQVTEDIKVPVTISLSKRVRAAAEKQAKAENRKLSNYLETLVIKDGEAAGPSAES